MGMDFTRGPVMPLLVRFFLPFLLANLINSVYNAVDTVIIGQFAGSSGIVAVSMGGKLLSLFTSLGIAFSGGGQVLISQLIGAKRRDELRATIGTMFTEMFFISVLLAAATLILSRGILVWFNMPEASFDAGLAYMRITCMGLPLIFGYNAVSAVLRGMGDSKHPLIFIAVAAAINLIGDIVFVVCFHLGAAGTAIATVLGQGCSFLFSVFLLYRDREKFGFDFRPRSFVPDRAKLRIMLRLGVPMAFGSCCINGTQLVISRYVNLFGLTQAAAYSIGDKAVQIANIFHQSVRQAAGSMVGQNIGADKRERVTDVVKSSALITFSAAACLSALALLFPGRIFSLFSRDQDVLAYAAPFMAIACIVFLLSALLGTFDSVVVGTGNTLLSTIGGLLDGVVFRACFGFLFAYGLHMGVTGFFLGDALARLGPVSVSGIYYCSGAWKRREKLVQN